MSWGCCYINDRKSAGIITKKLLLYCSVMTEVSTGVPVSSKGCSFRSIVPPTAFLCRQHCRLCICWHFGWVWQILRGFVNPLRADAESLMGLNSTKTNQTIRILPPIKALRGARFREGLKNDTKRWRRSCVQLCEKWLVQDESVNISLMLFGIHESQLVPEKSIDNSYVFLGKSRIWYSAFFQRSFFRCNSISQQLPLSVSGSVGQSVSDW